MNNSKLIFDTVILSEEPQVDNTKRFREREGELIAIIDSLQKVQSSKEWSTLKEKVFDGLPETFSKEIQNEARRDDPDTLKLNRLAGQLKWAEKYSDLKKLENIFRLELTNVRNQLHG